MLTDQLSNRQKTLLYRSRLNKMSIRFVKTPELSRSAMQLHSKRKNHSKRSSNALKAAAILWLENPRDFGVLS